MRTRVLRTRWKSVLAALTFVLLFAGPARAQQAPATSAEHESKTGPVVRTFGTEKGYRTEVRSETRGTLSPDDRRQVSLLGAQVFQHIDEARQAVDSDDTQLARKELDKGCHALEVIRALLPRTAVHTRTTAPDGKVIYEDEREVQDDQIPLFEGMLHAQTLAPIVAAKRDATEVSGVRVVGSESIATEALADLDLVESQLKKAAKALEQGKADDASRALATAQVRGAEFRYRKEDSPLAEARDAIWLARRSLEESNAVQAQVNLTMARQRLRIYREVAPQERRQDVDQMLREVEQLEAQLHQETAQQPASRSERERQGNAVTRWWEQINGWFKKHL
jgi:hypothetical protein